MTNLQTLIGMGVLWDGELIEWKVRPRVGGIISTLEAWIRKSLKQPNGGPKIPFAGIMEFIGVTESRKGTA